MEKIGIIGLGFVGGAIDAAFNKSAKVNVIRLDESKGFNATYEDLKECSSIFICVPSPQGVDGSCDTSILENVLQKIKSINYSGVIISKCTVPPTVYDSLQSLYPNLVHAPEFLTAANAINDYENGAFAIIGGNSTLHLREAERIISISQPLLKSVKMCSIAEAALAKYTINSFMATKVIFMNEIAGLAEKLGCNYELVANLVKSDARIGSSHMQVPGPDGQFGFGGACFPKDTAALLKVASDADVNLNVLDAAVKKNTLLRLQNSK